MAGLRRGVFTCRGTRAKPQSDRALHYLRRAISSAGFSDAGFAAAAGGSDVVRHGRNDPNLQFGFDLLAQMDRHRVQAQFLQRALEPDLIGGDREFVLLQRLDDFRRSDRAVQMAFVVSVRLDGDALASQFVGECAEAGQPLVLNRLQLRSMLFHHPLVMIGGDRGQTLRKQVVHRVAALHFDHVSLVAQVIDRLDQEQLDAAMRAAGEPFDSTGSFVFGSDGHGSSVTVRG